MKQLLKHFGADEKETQVFLKLLELGAQPVSVIAKHASMPRSSMYTVIERLKQLQLIEEFERAGIKYVKCIPVKNLKEVLKDREKEIQQTMVLLEAKLSDLQKLENTMSITPKVNFFEGKEAMLKMYKKILQEKSFCSFFNPQSVKKVTPEYFYLIPEELKKNRGKAKELLVNCPEAQEYKKKYQSQHHQIKILPARVIFYSDTIITKDTIYMVSYGENEIAAIEIVNHSLAQTQQKLFEELWNQY